MKPLAKKIVKESGMGMAIVAAILTILGCGFAGIIMCVQFWLACIAVAIICNVVVMFFENSLSWWE